MYDYAIFGGCLRSELEFPELRTEAGKAPTWFFGVGAAISLPPDAELLGVGLEPECRIKLFRHQKGFLLIHSCTGAYTISPDGQNICWHRRPSVPLELGRADILGRVLAVAMHAMGYLTLHASAAELGDGAVAFLAPKGTGKSTLALSLCAAGARFVTDDMLPVIAGDFPVVFPGIQSARLCHDSADLLQISSTGRIGIDGKRVVDRLAEEWLMEGSTPLSAIYLLCPTNFSLGVDPVRRVSLPASAAAIALVQHAKAVALLGKSEATLVFDRASKLARSVPVYRLEVARDLKRIDEVSELIASWHDVPAMVGA